MFDQTARSPANRVEKETIPGKAERTRTRLLNTSLALFRQRGYRKTTMRAIAKAAGLSLGASYYHFPSKEHLVEACYMRSHTEYLEACKRILEKKRDFRELLLRVMRAKVATLLPYERLTPQFSRSAANPRSILHPFRSLSEPVPREEAAVFQRLVEVSNLRISVQLRQELPGILRLYQRAVLLFWMYDRSEERIRTYRLVEGSANLLSRLIRLSAVPVMSPVTQSLLNLCREMRR